jgi:glycosyltransferase involved in cell wall biosynthesis
VDEPFPLTVLEALRAGVPSVVTDRCSIADDLARRGAAVVATPDPVSLADGVRLILTDSAVADRLAEAGPAAVKDAYALSGTVDRLLDCYMEAVA